MQVPIVEKVITYWKLSLFCLLFFPILISLGVWQLDRAQDKQQRLTVYQQRKLLPAKKVDQPNSERLAVYQNIQLSGVFDTQRYWLLDNISRQGQTGYEVIMPFRLLTSDDWVLVNRGWIAAPRLRSELPVIDTPEYSVDIEGYIYPTTKNAIFSATESDLKESWPKRVLQLDMELVKHELADKVYSQLLRINQSSAGALQADWNIVNTSPQKHQGYALQWFSMAGVLLILYCWVLIKNNKKAE